MIKGSIQECRWGGRRKKRESLREVYSKGSMRWKMGIKVRWRAKYEDEKKSKKREVK